jgi:hypothetical protein
MAAAATGSVVGIHYDTASIVAPGHAIVSRTGRTYLVLEARRQERGRHIGRWHLQCLVADGGPPADATVHPLFWYRRERARRAA